MERLIELVEKAKEVEKKAEKEYIRGMKKLKEPEYVDIKNLFLRITIDTVLHKNIMEALEKSYSEALDLIEEFEGEAIADNTVLIPGVPMIAMPLEFGVMNERIPPIEVLEEYFKEFPETAVIPEEKLEEIREILEKYLELQKEMANVYKKLTKKVSHPIIKQLMESIANNEEQHSILLKKLFEKYKQ
ncbi:ferritin family protein [Thermococcus paralvinellae]|uniref:Rubrerythrin diiron-binding domain-containing protein n=1 Tax=Thermococcus paralvinellae TaxID=582419 RepID=W0I5V5_9EURY|nr:ferritin family protein [Thermococcus paralvinellae]AHF79835.1 Hypothetical protein TES1_0441 [Thermococcus paralvinellae]